MRTLQTATGRAYTNTSTRGIKVTVAGSGTNPATISATVGSGGVTVLASPTSFYSFASGTSSRTINVFDINPDDINEGHETFTVTISDPAAGEFETAGGDDLAGTVDFTTGGNRTHSVVVEIIDDNAPGITVTPSEVSEGQTATFTVSLNAGWAVITPERPRFEWSTEDGTATTGQDYTAASGDSILLASGIPLTSDPWTFTIDIAQDNVSDDGETFTIVIQAPDPPGLGAGSIATLRHEVTIREGPVTPPGPNRPGLAGSDPILSENSNHLVAQSEAILAVQPRLADYARNAGVGATDFELRVSNGGLDAFDGNFAGEGFWGEAALSRSSSRGADGAHALAVLGAHRKVSDRIFLGGMLQFDRTVTKLDGGGRSGEFAGEGWLAGPYVVARDSTGTLLLEGRLLYGRASHDADAVDAGDGPKDGSFDSERWVAQARVEGETS